jgi:D-lactate dehydrogenase (cytochrome)
MLAAMTVHFVPVERPRGSVGQGSKESRDPEITAGYLRDASGEVGQASALFRPESEADVAEILARAHREQIAVTVVAGQTSTTASSVPSGGWVLSTERLSKQGEIDAAGLRATCEAGVRLGEFQDRLAEAGLLYPPDPTSRYECTVGGSVACNASGPRSHRYGPTRRWIRALRIVLVCGEVVHLRRGDWVGRTGDYFEIVHADDPERCALRGSSAPPPSRVPVPGFSMPDGIKHAAGYYAGSAVDLIDLFIGSEGTLGVVTEIEVELVPMPESCLSLFIFFEEESRALELIESTRTPHDTTTGTTAQTTTPSTRPDSLEWFDHASLQLIAEAMPDFKVPERARVALFIEQLYSDEDGGDLIRDWFAKVKRCGAMIDEPGGVRVAQSAEQHEELRRVRHAVPVGVNERAARNGMPKLGTDLSVADVHLRTVVALYHRAAAQPLQLLDAQALRTLLAELGFEIGPGDPVSPEVLRAAGLPQSLEAITFGHVGDNHLHVNFLPRDKAGLALARSVYSQLTRTVIEMGGSPSAEHGIGKIKRAALRQWVGEAGIAEMLEVKRALDPHGCLGRGNLFEERDVAGVAPA